MRCIILWKVVGAPWIPNGIVTVVNSHNTSGVVNAVFFLDSSEKGNLRASCEIDY